MVLPSIVLALVFLAGGSPMLLGLCEISLSEVKVPPLASIETGSFPFPKHGGFF